MKHHKRVRDAHFDWVVHCTDLTDVNRNLNTRTSTPKSVDMYDCQRGIHLLVGKDDASVTVHRGLEGEPALTDTVVQVNLVPLDHQGCA